MNEAEFRSQLEALGREYQEHIADRNAEDSPGLKSKHNLRALAVLSEISALEKKREVAKAYAYIKLRDGGMRVVKPSVVAKNADVVTPKHDLEYWRERRTAKLKEGAHIAVINYIDQQIRALKEPDPESDTLSWIDYHDRLSKEWAAGELALINDLYPDPPEKLTAYGLARCAISMAKEDPVTGPLIAALPAAARTVSAAALITAVLVMLVWLAKMLIGF